MTELILIATVAVSAGILSGALFFLGLRATVARLTDSGNRARLVVVSAVLRFAFVLGVMVALAAWHVVAAPLALIGFLTARMLVLGRAGRRVAPVPVRRGRDGSPSR